MVSMLESYQLDQFQRTGNQRANALCPFHEDHKTPSLHVDGQRGVYKCFGCGVGGDIFHFVRHHHKHQHQGQELPFWQAVQKVQAFAETGRCSTTSTTSSTTSMGQRWTSEEAQERMEQRERLYAMNQEAAAFYAQNLRQPFAGGARYYLQSRGFESPSTVKAFGLGYAPDLYFGVNHRNLPTNQTTLVRHLEACGYSPEEILASGLAIQTKQKKKSPPPPPKLLQDNNGSTTSKNTAQSDSNVTSTTSSNQTQHDATVDIATLMDRFRGRLVVPIFDHSGTKVVGFGGRILPNYNDEEDDNNPNTKSTTSFTPPKYLNSPETLVFQKKNILFAQHMVQEHYQTTTQQQPQQSTRDPAKKKKQPRDLLMVEGYMDVLALWDHGIYTAVATMGTAVSLEQVAAAAKLAATNGVRVVLCLDQDPAGLAALERLCSGGFLRKAADSHAVSFCIATLPEGMKDPGDYMEQHKHQPDTFWKQVVEPAVDWSQWFLQRILDRYNPSATGSTTGSFGDIFQRVANFLSTFSNPADRTKTAYEVAGRMAELMAQENSNSNNNNYNGTSKAVHMQLESDLIEAASKIATARDIKKRRSETLETSSPGDQAIEVDKLSKSALKKLRRDTRDTRIKPESRANGVSNMPKLERSAQPTKRPRRRMYRPLTEKEPPALTPHFAGFQFENPTDADWLGIPRNKAKAGNSILTLGDLHSFEEHNGRSRKDRPKPVYFNSNDYHGQHFLSSDAVLTGYKDTKNHVSEFKSIMQNGVSSLLQEDIQGNLIAAEDALFQSLVSHYPEARNAVKDVLQARASIGGPDVEIQWSSPDREWLFQCLVEDDVMDQSDTNRCDLAALRAALLERKDAPSGAFCNEMLTDESIDMVSDETSTSTETLAFNRSKRGTLDRFFVRDVTPASKVDNDSNLMATEREGAALAAQEQLMSLLSASASREIQVIQNDLHAASLLLKGNSSSTDEEIAMPSVPNSGDMNVTTHASGLLEAYPVAGMARIERNNLQKGVDGALHVENNGQTDNYQRHVELLHELQGAIERRNQLDRSTKQITERLMRFSGSTFAETVEGRISVPLQKRLAKELDAHLVDIDGKVMDSKVDQDDRLGTHEETDSSVLDELAEIEENWGDWCDDAFIWSPEQTTRNGGSMVPQTIDISDLEDEDVSETLEETLDRIDHDWNKWMD